jgi:arylsulfatase A-like enzyme
LTKTKDPFALVVSIYMIKKILCLFIFFQFILTFDLCPSPSENYYRFLDNLHTAEWKEFSTYNISPKYEEIIARNGLIIDEKIDNSEFGYANDSGGDGTSEHWFYKPKYRMYLPDVLKPQPEFIVKKDGKNLIYQHVLFSYKTPVDRWDVDECGIYVTVPDSNGLLAPIGNYSMSYFSSIKEEQSLLNFKYNNEIPSIFFRKYLTISNDTRDCLYLPAPSEINFKVPIKKNGKFTCSVGIVPGFWFNESDGAIFEIYIKQGSKGSSEKVFENDIDISNTANHKWFEITLDLKNYEGKQIEITLKTKEKKNKFFDYCAVANPIIYYDTGTDDNYKNVILVSIDNVRADHIGCYGSKRNSSPYMDKFSKNSVTFKRCIAQASWTLPSHMSIFTSKIASEHGVWDTDTILEKENITLTEILHKEGYLTKGIVTHKFLGSEYGFNKGFESYVYNQDKNASVVSNEAIDWISKNKQKPFFLFLHYFDPHFDYNPPRPYNKLHDPFYKGEVAGTLGFLYKYSDPRNKIDPVDLEHLKALYDGEISFSDKAMDSLIKGIRKLNLLDKTMIIITSDHGEEFKDHGSMLHGTTLFEEQLLVPLIIHTPDCIPAIIDLQVESIDIAPTILSFLDLTKILTFDGQSLYSQLHPKNGQSDYRVVPAFSESKRFGPYRVSVTTSSEKYFCSFAGIFNDEKYFNLQNDPREFDNRLVFDYGKAEALINILAYKIPNYTVERKWFLQYFTPSIDEKFEIEITGSSGFKILNTENISKSSDKVINNVNGIKIVSKNIVTKKIISFIPEKYSSNIKINFRINSVTDTKRVQVGSLSSEEIKFPLDIKHDFIKDYRYNVKPNSGNLLQGGILIWCNTNLKFVLSPNAKEKTKQVILDGESIKLLKSLGYIQ